MSAQRCLFVGLAFLVSACSKAPQSAAVTTKPYTYVSGPTFSDKKVTYEARQGVPIFQGDIKLARTVFAAEAVRAMKESGRLATSLSSAYRDYFWSGSTIPYTVEGGTAFQAAVTDALADLETRAKINFVPRTTEADYLTYVFVESDEICGQSFVGQLGGKQEIEIATDCVDRETVQHETMHALGFWHEQSRPDRDDFIRILWANVKPDYLEQFDVMPVEADGVGDYDFASIMHYRRDAFSVNGRDTIQADTEAHNALIGNSTEASPQDVLAIQSVYGTATKVDLDEETDGNYSATFTFRTATPVQTRVKLGADRESFTEFDIDETGTSHRIVLSALAPKTRFFYRVLTESGWSPARSFITDLVAPEIIDPRVYRISQGVVEVRFATNEKTQGSVGFYSDAPDSEVQWAYDSTFGKIHNVRFAVGQGTTLLSAVAIDEAGNLTVSDELTVFNDSQAPAISNIRLTSLTTSTATVAWITDEASTSTVRYGTNASALTSIATIPGNGLSHAVTLSGLSGDTTYFYRVESKDAADNTATSDVRTFSTDLTAPVITTVTVASVGTDRAEITWSTNEAASTHVAYGTSCTSLTLISEDAAAVTSHSRLLTGLSPNTSYCYRVSSKDAQGNESVSATAQFTTRPVEILTLSGITSSPTASSVTIAWTSSLGADSVVEYGPSSGAYPYSVSASAIVTSHSLTLTQNLTSGTTYYYRVRSTTALGTTVVSAPLSFFFVQHDSVSISVRNDAFSWLPRYVTATSTFPQNGATTLTMRIVTREGGITVYAREMEYQWFPNTYTYEIPAFLTWDIFNGWLRIRVDSSLGGSATY